MVESWATIMEEKAISLVRYPGTTMKALGIDVGVRKGLDLVLLKGDRRVLENRRHVETREVPSYIDRWDPDVIAIDSPPAFPTKGRRKTEEALRHLDLPLFWTPWEPSAQGKRFYNWMKVGFRVYERARSHGFALFDGGLSPKHRAIEVYPFASAAILSGSGRPPGLSKSVWRRAVLEDVGVDTMPLRGVDQIDAALAAYTGLKALSGQFCWFGVLAEGVIALPCRRGALLPSYARVAAHPRE